MDLHQRPTYNFRFFMVQTSQNVDKAFHDPKPPPCRDDTSHGFLRNDTKAEKRETS